MRTDDNKNIFDLTVTALNPLKGNLADRDAARVQLFNILNDIYKVRNWWAHQGAGNLDCKKARQMINFFFKYVYDSGSEALRACFSKDDIQNIDSVGDSLASGLSIDDVAFVIFGRAKQQLCEFCSVISVRLPDIKLSKLLNAELLKKVSQSNMKGRNSSMEVSEVLAVLKDYTEKNNGAAHKSASDKSSNFHSICYDCDVITKCRNSLSHATKEADQVILVLVALSSVVRVTEHLMRLVNESLLYLPRPISGSELSASSVANIENIVYDLMKQGKSYSDSVVLFQAELLARCNLCDMSRLIDQFFLNDQVNTGFTLCPFRYLISHGVRPIEQLRSLQLILEQKKYISLKDNRGAHPNHTKSMRLLFYLIAHVPHVHTESLDQALDWLLRTADVESDMLLQCFGPHVLVGVSAQSFFARHEKSDPTGLFQSFCKTFTDQQERKHKLCKKKSEYFEECRKSPQVFGKAEALFQQSTLQSSFSADADAESKAEFWSERIRCLKAQIDMHALIEIANSVHELLKTPPSQQVSIVDLKKFLKRLGLILFFVVFYYP
jgi:hypothetical protein